MVKSPAVHRTSNLPLFAPGCPTRPSLRGNRLSARSIVAAIGAVLLAFTPAEPAGGQPAGFTEEVVFGGLNLPVGMAFGPGERMYIWEKGGVVRIAENGQLLPQPLLDLSDEVNTYWTRGMTGLALDPDFENNGYVYLAFTVDWEYYITGGNPNQALLDTNHDTFGRIVRYTLDAATDFTVVVPASRWVMIGDTHDSGFAVTLASHTQNTIVFAPDGTMLISAGDGASMLSTDIGGPREACCSSNTAEADGILAPKEQIGAWRAQLVDTHSGKILRVDPATADGLPSNPFYDANAACAPRSRVWSLGLRNPYAFTVRPGTGSTVAGDGDPGVLVIGDVGWDNWERLCVSKQGGQNFGWPAFEGLTSAVGYPATQTANLDAPNPLFNGGSCAVEFFKFTDLIVQETLNTPSWPNPCDAGQQIPAALTSMHTRAVLAWRNSRVWPAAFSLVPTFDGNGEALAVSITSPGSPVTGPHIKGVATVGGVFYTSDKFPAEYRDWYYFAEAGNGSNGGWVNRARFDEQHDLVEVDLFRQTSTITPTSLVMSPDGYGLYYANHKAGVSGQIRRITVDCNGNGVGDDIDLADGTSFDKDGNGVPDDCDCHADFNNNGGVEIDDFLTLLAAWGPCAGCAQDLDGDGNVGILDFLILLASWGPC